jgi:pimeloyl-ACP methyl ester carboxylesterase
MRNHGGALRAVAVMAAAGLVAALASAAADASATQRAVPQAGITGTTAARVPVLKWRACGGSWQCARARVPLSYRDPRGAKISIALLRHRATDPARRLGSLFFNGGGPQEQIVGFRSLYPSLPAAVRQRFDIITFDPRGFGLSTAVRCFPTAAAEQKFLGALAVPVGAKQDARWEQKWARFDARCAKTNGALLDHDTSADVARDMNLLRAAVHDPVLNYLGVSYGTGIGAIYANLFPSRVGRMILDANLDPKKWTNSPGGRLPYGMRERIDEANAAAMTAFLNLCGKATRAACAFSAGTPAATRAKWHTLLRRLRARPVTIGSPPQTFTYYDAFQVVDLGAISSWQQGAVQLQQLWAASATTTAAPAASRTPATASVYTGLEQGLAVQCSDDADPRNPSTYATAAKLAFARSSGFGSIEVWENEICAKWPGNGGRDRYTGSWNHRTTNPILLIGITGDAVFPYRDDLAMEHDLARARLLTVRGYGHTELANPSTCATNYELSYLQTGALPPPGTICQQNATPFPSPQTPHPPA